MLALAATFALAVALPIAAMAQHKAPLTQVSVNFLPSSDTEVEPYVAANPTNPKNIVASWFTVDDLVPGSTAVIAGVTFDGGKSWRNVVVPLTTISGGGPYIGVVDDWLSFAPNGDLYLVCLAYGGGVADSAILLSKSEDGGQTWSTPTALALSADASIASFDKPSVTADPTNSRRIYAAWDTYDATGVSTAWFARSMDGGRTWEPGKQIYAPTIRTNGTTNNQLRVLPDGTLLDIFTEYDGTGTQSYGLLSVIRSTNRGQTWSKPTRAAALPTFFATDPDTGALIVNLASLTPLAQVAVDPHNGYLYAVWEDNRFSNGAYGEIAFSMSENGGQTWSTPVLVNKTPHNIPPGDRQAFEPTVAVVSDGTIGVTYYDFRFNNPDSGCATDYWLVRCHPSPHRSPTQLANWGDEVRLTDSSFDLEIAPIGFGIGFDLGDYYGLATAGKDFLPVWTMTHGTDPSSVFFRRVRPDEDD